jgi:hypothetical protein
MHGPHALGRGQMPDYRAYILSRDGKIVEAVDFVSDDDEAAKSHTRSLAGGNVVELWQGKRCVEILKRAYE